MSERNDQAKMMDGMQAALQHAIDMNGNGRLDANELDEFRRFLIGESLNGMSMQEHSEARSSGQFDRLREESGQNPRDDREIHPDDLLKSRKGIAGKIAADYITQLWDDGQIDDADYAQRMQALGVIEPPMEVGNADPAAQAEAAYRGASGGVQAEDSDAERERVEMDKYVSSRRKKPRAR